VITPADSAPVAPGQMPAAPNAGPAPVPFGGDQSAGNAPLPPMAVPHGTPGPEVMGGVTGANHVTEAPWAAPNVNPYEAGGVSAIYVGGDADAGGRDDVSGSVAGAVAAAEARFGEHQSDLGAGSHIGDLMALPAKTSDGSTGGAFYDPPRDYGG
jgi:hypothetical protein